MAVLGGGAHRELVHVGLAEEDGVGGAEFFDDGGVIGWFEVRKHAAAAGGGFTLGAEDVLDGDGDTGEGAEGLTLAALVVEGAGLGDHALGVDVDEGVEPGVEPLDSIETGAGDVFGGTGASGLFIEKGGSGGAGDVHEESLTQSREDQKMIFRTTAEKGDLSDATAERGSVFMTLRGSQGHEGSLRERGTGTSKTRSQSPFPYAVF